MKRDATLVVVSLLNLLLLMIHIAQDTILQPEGKMTYPIPVIVFALLLYVSLAASERVWGNIVMLLGGLFGVGMIVVHAKGIVVRNTGGLFFVWTMFALAATGWVTILLSARALSAAYHRR